MTKDQLQQVIDIYAENDTGGTGRRLKVDAAFAGDIALGAVEIKDATTDTRAVVKTDGTNNALVVTKNLGTTSTETAVGASGSSTTLKAANTSRKKLVIVNDGLAVLYVKEGATASTVSYTYKLQPNDSVIIDDYNGIVDGIWSVVNGSAYITETV